MTISAKDSMMNQLRQLNFVAFKGKSLTSRAIRWWTKSKTYSHIAILSGGPTSSCLIEAWPHKGGIRQWWDFSSFKSHTPGTYYEIWCLPVDEKVYQYCMEQFCMFASTKISYDWKGIAGFVFKTMKDSRRGMFCSEGAIKPLVDKMKWSKINPGQIDPQSFIEIIQAAGAKRIKTGIS